MATVQNDLRLQIHIKKVCHPELFDVLSQVALRHRAERVRMLANLAAMGSSATNQRPVSALPTTQDEFRVQIHVKKGFHPELFDVLSQVAPRHRAERVRMLATLAVTGSNTGPQSPPAMQNGQGEVKEKKRAIKGVVSGLRNNF